MTKAVFFVDGFQEVSLEFETTEAAFDLVHTNSFGLTKSDCIALFNQNNGFLSATFHTPAKLKNALVKAGLDESAFHHQSYPKRKWIFANEAMILLHNEKAPDMDEFDDELIGESTEMVERVFAYRTKLTREIKIDELGI